MTITGYQFDRAKVSATKDSALYRALSRGEDFVLGDQGQELAVTVSGRNIRVGTGMALIQGRLVEVTAAETVTVPINSSGYLVIEINLSQTNTSNGALDNSYTFTINQVALKFVTTLTNNRIFDGGLLYHFVLGTVTSNATNATFRRSAGIDDRGNGDMHARRHIYAGGKLIQHHQLTNNDGSTFRSYDESFNANTASGFYHKSSTSPGNPSGVWGFLYVMGDGDNLSQLFIERDGSRRMFVRARTNGVYTPWLEYAALDTTARFEKVLQTHTSNREVSAMHGIKLNVVRKGNTVTVSVKRAIYNIPNANEYVLASETLPTGFRPATEAHLVMVGNSGTTVGANAVIHLQMNGGLRLTNQITGNQVWSGTVTYLTNDPYP